MENPEKVILTNMCMIFDGTKLLVQKKVGKGFKGITCPGGHVEPGEPIVDSVIREIKEETGLTIKSPKLCGIKDWFEEGQCGTLTKWLGLHAVRSIQKFFLIPQIIGNQF